jgi:hypothetical protein
MTTMPHAQVRRRLIQFMVMPLALAALGGCASGPLSKAARTAALLERAKAYWSAVQANDNITAWNYENVSKDPTWTLQSYLQRGGIVYNAVEVIGVQQLEDELAVVNVSMEYSVPMVRLRNQHSKVNDRWRLIDGQWFHVLSNGAGFDAP